MFITCDQILCHFIGDFFLQSDWVGLNKYNKFIVALAHACWYTLPFIFLTINPWALLTICLTHAIIDHYKLAAYISWAKNWLSPVRPKPWKSCCFTGNDPERPLWISVWLNIIVDNVTHIIINGAAIYYFG
jgi:hypothetical protein